LDYVKYGVAVVVAAAQARLLLELAVVVVDLVCNILPLLN
jgi:hypothetical protein